LNDGFLAVTCGPGFCGFIGAEAKIPDIFTLRFVTQFIDWFYASGETIEHVMRTLRKAHLPLSLAFSLSCARDLRLSVAKPRPLPAELPPNFSYEPVASV
jgi:hypothetical protein